MQLCCLVNVGNLNYSGDFYHVQSKSLDSSVARQTVNTIAKSISPSWYLVLLVYWNPEKLLSICFIPPQHWHNVYIGSALFIKDWEHVLYLLSYTFLIIYLIVDTLLYNGPCMFFVMIYVLLMERCNICANY